MRFQSDQTPQTAQDTVAVEEPLEIRVRGQSVAVTMRTPGHDEDLAAGFLFTEGLIHTAADVTGIAHCRSAPLEARPNIVNVFLAADAAVDPGRMRRNFYASSSCGICGKASIEMVQQHFPPLEDAPSVFPFELLKRLPERLRAAQSNFTRTGGSHAAAVFDWNGNLVAAREDVGRHNAVDKVIGHALRHGLLPLDRHLLLVSGRASFEILQKALAARLPVVASVSAPSSLAVAFARESGQTLVGFLRGDTMNVYSGPQRLQP